MITVDYPPGGADPVHRHNASAFVYVLEGSSVLGRGVQRVVETSRGDAGAFPRRERAVVYFHSEVGCFRVADDLPRGISVG